MSIDELDHAFNAGFIHSRTNVLAPGSFKWTTLGEAAGLEEEPPYVEQTPSLAPMAIAGGQYSLPQVPAYQPYALSNMGLDDDDLYPKRSKKGIVIGFMVAAVVGACAFLVSTGKLDALQSTVASTHVESKVSSATLAPAAEEKLPEPAKPAAEAPKPAETTPAAPAAKITDDVKQRLLDADKEREAKAKAKAGKKRRVRSTSDGNSNPAPKGESQKLIEGGDKYDPLNSSI